MNTRDVEPCETKILSGDTIDFNMRHDRLQQATRTFYSPKFSIPTPGESNSCHFESFFLCEGIARSPYASGRTGVLGKCSGEDSTDRRAIFQVLCFRLKINPCVDGFSSYVQKITVSGVIVIEEPAKLCLARHY